MRLRMHYCITLYVRALVLAQLHTLTQSSFHAVVSLYVCVSTIAQSCSVVLLCSYALVYALTHTFVQLYVCVKVAG